MTNTTVALESDIARFDDFNNDISNYQGDPFGLTISHIFAVNPFNGTGRRLLYTSSQKELCKILKMLLELRLACFCFIGRAEEFEIAMQNEAANDTINKVELYDIILAQLLKMHFCKLRLNCLQLEVMHNRQD